MSDAINNTAEDAAAGLGLELGQLREAIRDEYSEVAENPEKGFHFHTGRKLARILEYADDLLAAVPEDVLQSFAGTGNPFRLGEIHEGESVVDVGSGAGIDSFVAAQLAGPRGQVVGVDMTPAMLEKAEAARKRKGVDHLEFRRGHAEHLPVEDNWADVIISNGVLNLTPSKQATLQEWHRVLKPGGRLQIADILVEKEVPQGAKEQIDLWTG